MLPTKSSPSSSPVLFGRSFRSKLFASTSTSGSEGLLKVRVDDDLLNDVYVFVNSDDCPDRDAIAKYYFKAEMIEAAERIFEICKATDSQFASSREKWVEDAKISMIAKAHASAPFQNLKEVLEFLKMDERPNSKLSPRITPARTSMYTSSALPSLSAS